MAEATFELTGDVDALVDHVRAWIGAGSVTARLEHEVEQRIGEARMVSLVFERFSATGSNRLSLSISILGIGERLAVTVITSGGSQGVFFKVNRFGENAFLDKAREALEAFSG